MLIDEEGWWRGELLLLPDGCEMIPPFIFTYAPPKLESSPDLGGEVAVAVAVALLFRFKPLLFELPAPAPLLAFAVAVAVALATSVAIPSDRIISTLTASIAIASVPVPAPASADWRDDWRGNNHWGSFEAVSSTAIAAWNANVGSSPIARPPSLIRLRITVLSNHGASLDINGDDNGNDNDEDPAGSAPDSALLASCCC
mmetsp:Transcript_10835/g.16363  ORF Transcript_10835/g.16363 Transcript_10835/m.16363 type:complete len:200 (-) Transcript_10835:1275-1874(-)